MDTPWYSTMTRSSSAGALPVGPTYSGCTYSSESAIGTRIRLPKVHSDPDLARHSRPRCWDTSALPLMESATMPGPLAGRRR